MYAIPPNDQEIFHNNDINRCKPVSGMAEIDPKLDVILKRCTAGAPWTSVPFGADREDVTEANLVS